MQSHPKTTKVAALNAKQFSAAGFRCYGFSREGEMCENPAGEKLKSIELLHRMQSNPVSFCINKMSHKSVFANGSFWH